MRAVNAGGAGTGAPNAAPWYAAATPEEPPDPPGPVSSVTVTRTDGTVTASWDAPSGAAKYHVTYNDGTGWHAPVPGHDNITATSLTFSADNARTYVVGVRAGNAAGWSGWVNSPAAGPYTPPNTTQPPDPVLRLHHPRRRHRHASWDAPSGAAKYHVT